MLISLALILGTAFGDLPSWGLVFLLVTWIPDVPITLGFIDIFNK